MADFLSGLGKIINDQFGYGENGVSSLDNDASRMGNFGLLGDFANKFDRSAERTYIEDGLINNVRPRMREIISQQPDITVVIKKRMFSSLIENDRLELLEEKERLFLRASKKLFQNKCKLMAAYERLTKVETLSSETGQFNTSLLPMVLQDIEEIERSGFSFFDPETRAQLDVLRKALAFSESTNFTSWVNDYDSVFAGDLGEGTGVMELTTVATLSTSVSTDFGGGNCTFTIEDPYKIMHITDRDIDAAIAASNNFFKTSPFGSFVGKETQEAINELENRLAAMRADRTASQLDFHISQQSIISKRLRVIMRDEGREVNFTYKAGLVGINAQVEIDPQESFGKNGLTDEESEIFKEIVGKIYLLMGYEATTASQLIERNQEINYVRNRMRLFFGKKSIVQYMDVVNIFMTTRTLEDESITAGFPGYQSSAGLNTGQLINNLVGNINTSLSNISGEKNAPDEIEKAAIVGPNFPTWLWRLFRNNFTKQGAGTAIFVGLVKNVTQNFSASSGKFIVTVNCEDNTGYFNKSQINVKPALNVFNSALYDPLTPFNVSFDAATGQPINEIQDGAFPPLLPENETLLQTRALKFSSTDFKGQNANQVLYKTKKNEIVFGKLRRILADAQGFVYRWKQGIQSITKVERVTPDNQIQSESPPRLTTNPFAGQDVMNVLSLLITGQPYNYNTFLKAALSNVNDIVAYDPAQNTDAHSSYIDGLIRDLSKRNVIWGNFVPFKGMTVNDESFAFLRKGQSDLTTKQDKLQSLLKERAALVDRRALTSAQLSANDIALSSPVISGLDRQINLLDLTIEQAQINFSNETSEILKKNKNNITIIGDDISIDPGFDEFDGSNAVNDSQRSLSRAALRRKINTLTLRRLWKVKANNDTNLFVVDDQYDKNYDIQAFERKIGSELKLFDSEYTTVDIQIKATAEILGLEVFADSQGHIRARPPAYNKVPSSVFYKMFKDRDETGVKVFPDFLESLLFNQTQGLIDRIETTEDQIRLRAIALGVSGTTASQTDAAILKFIRGNVDATAQVGFAFLSEPTTGRIPGQSLRNIQTQSAPDVRSDQQNISLEALEQLNDRARAQVNLNSAFDINARVDGVLNLKFTESYSDTTTKTIDLIRQRLLRNKGVKAPTASELFSNERMSLVNGAVSAVASMNIVRDITNYVKERQVLVRELANVTRNLSEGLRINIDDAGAKTTLTPFLNRKTTIPSILEHMIEDETLDDIGIGSGNRYVIKASQIINFTMTENPPAYTTVQVNGMFGEGFVDPATSLNINLSGASGGNAVTSAYAVDYDLWRQYGFKVPNSVPAPFFSDPESQCAPYAVALLNLARKNIIQGSLQITGRNEFYQAGDVIFIEDYDLLFYVNSVSHTFSYSGQLSTTLSLTYGHSPGEYIPTQLDIVGKYLYSAQTFSEQFRSSRFENDGDDISLGSIVVAGESDMDDLLKGPNGKQNKSILNKMLLGATGELNPVSFKNKKPILQIRIYGEVDGATDRMKNAAQNIKYYLLNPQTYSALNDEVIGEKINSNFVLGQDQIQLVEVDISQGGNGTSPSASAWNCVRAIDKAGYINSFEGTGSVSSQGISSNAAEWDRILCNNIVDIWVTFEDVATTLSTSSQNNQAAQLGNAVVDSAKSAAIGNS